MNPTLARPHTPRSTAESWSTLRPLLLALGLRQAEPAFVLPGRRGPHALSYEWLSAQVRAVAGGLRARGVAPGERVGLFAPPGPAWVACGLGALRAGAVVTPLDPQLLGEELTGVLADADLRLLFTDRRRAANLEQVLARRRLLLDAPAEDPSSWRRLRRLGGARDLAEVGPDDPAALFYTSGTTGFPKGVPLTHRNLGSQLEVLAAARLIERSDRVLMPLPAHHVYPFVLGLLYPLSRGAALVFPRALTGPAIQAALGAGGVTAMVGVPRLYAALVAAIDARLEGAGLPGWPVRAAWRTSTALRRRGLRWGTPLLRAVRERIAPALRVLASGGAALDEELAWRLEGLGWTVVSGYGLTETSPLLTLDLPDRDRFGTAGLPVAGVELRISRRGEVQARGPNVFAGYRGRDEATRAAFTRDGWFRTGDLGQIEPSGALRLRGRASTMLVGQGGENVQPEAVEAAYEAHPAIREVGVLPHEGGLAALVVPAGEADEQTLRAALQERGRRLPSHQRVGAWELTRAPLPRTRLGKLRRHLLRARWEEARRGEGDGAGGGPLPEEELAPADRQLLEIPAARAAWELLAERYADRRLTPDTSPGLDLGLDSLDWLEVSATLAAQSGVELSEEALGRIETVRDLLEELASGGGAGEKLDLERALHAPLEVLSPRHQRWLRPLPRSLELLARLTLLIGRPAFRLLLPVRVRGRERLPAGQCVLAPNHQSLLDPFALSCALPRARLRRTAWGGWTGIAFKNPLLRWLSRLARVVPIDPGAGPATSLALGAAVLQRGDDLVWFPEGERSRDGRLLPFRPGLGHLLQAHPLPVVPVSIAGSGQALPRGSLRLRRRPITITFGAPLDPRELAERGKGESPPRRLVAALREEVARLQSAPGRPA